MGLLEHIGRGLDDATNLPDADVLGESSPTFFPHFSTRCLGEMEDAKAFKERNLATAQKFVPFSLSLLITLCTEQWNPCRWKKQNVKRN